MATHTLTLEIPDELYQDLRQEAAFRNGTVEDLVLQKVTAVSSPEKPSEDLDQLLASMTYLEDAVLWGAAHSHLPMKAARRLTALNSKNQREGLTAKEFVAQTDLMRQYERFMLIRAQAALLLKQRGQDISGLGLPLE